MAVSAAWSLPLTSRDSLGSSVIEGSEVVAAIVWTSEVRCQVLADEDVVDELLAAPVPARTAPVM